MSEPQKTLGNYHVFALIVSSMIGTGIFTTSGFALASIGNVHLVMTAWFLGALIALCGTISYVSLTQKHRESGGEYLILSRTIHPLAGFLTGWISLTAGFTAPIAISAHALEAYMGLANTYWVGAGAIILIGSLQAVSQKGGLGIQGLAVILKILAILAFIGFSFFVGSTWPEAPSDFMGSPGGFVISLIWISFSFSGWNAFLYIASEIRDLDRGLLVTSILAVTIVSICYLALNYIFIYFTPRDVISGKAEVGRLVAAHLGGESLESLFSVTVVLALFTSMSAMIMTGPRVYSKMAQEGVFPGEFKFKGPTPRGAIVFQVVLSLVAYSFATLAQLMTYAGYLLSFSGAVAVSTLFLKAKHFHSYKAPLTLIPIVYILASLATSGFVIYNQPLEAFWGGCTLLLGLPFYYLLKR